jgi:hypothetical protein
MTPHSLAPTLRLASLTLVLIGAGLLPLSAQVGGGDPLPNPIPLAGGLGGFAGGAAPAEETPAEGITPRGALWRSALIPGWGQAVTGAPVRAAFFLTTQAGNAWMLAKTQGQLSWATRVLEGVEQDATLRFLADGAEPGPELERRVRTDAAVAEARGLRDARQGQREDWIALTAFFVLMGGIDAFVSGHLQNFPEPLTVDLLPGEGGERLEVGFSIPWSGPGAPLGR